MTGRSALDYAREKPFKPLGIEDVRWRADPQGVSTGGFGLYLLPRDMARLGTLWLHDGTWEGQRLLPPGWIDAVRHATIEMGLPSFDMPTSSGRSRRKLEVETLGNDDAGIVTFDGKAVSGRLETSIGFKVDFKGEAEE